MMFQMSNQMTNITDEQRKEALEWVDRAMLSCGGYLEDIRKEDCTGCCEYDDLCMKHRKTILTAFEPQVVTREWAEDCIEKLSPTTPYLTYREYIKAAFYEILAELGIAVKGE